MDNRQEPAEQVFRRSIRVLPLLSPGGGFAKSALYFVARSFLSQCCRTSRFFENNRPTAVLPAMGGFTSVRRFCCGKQLGEKRFSTSQHHNRAGANRWLSRFVDRCFIVSAAAKPLQQSNVDFTVTTPVRAATFQPRDAGKLPGAAWL